MRRAVGMDALPKVVVFDAFGTLIKIGGRRSPYLKLMKWLRSNGRTPSNQDARIIMSHNFDFKKWGEFFGEKLPVELLEAMNMDLALELKTIQIYPDVISTLQYLKKSGLKIALCSNLAMPYGEHLKGIITDYFDAVIFSYEVGAIKPQKRIYEIIEEKIDYPMSQMLFIGDNQILDVDMPITLGMSARLIDRENGQSLIDILDDLINI